MARISGAQSDMGLEISTTWGTAVAAGAGDRLVAEATPNLNVSELIARGIGSGKVWAYQATQGARIPSVDLVGEFGFRNNWDKLFAIFYGTADAPTETTASQGDYKHQLRINTAPTKYACFAYADSTTTTVEFPSAVVTAIGLKSTSIPGYLEASASLLGSKFELSSAVNTNAALANTTFTESSVELAAFDTTDLYRHNAQGGSGLGGGDTYGITEFDLSLERPYEIRPEANGTSSYSAPVPTDLGSGTLNITVKELADHAMYTVWSAETAYKASLSCEGTQIGSGTNKAVVLYCPLMKMVDPPSNAFTSAGVNALSLTWRLLCTTAAPTGMTGILYPSFDITNTLSTSLLA